MDCSSTCEYREQLSELHVLKRKLASKIEAMCILSQELAECTKERDHFKSSWQELSDDQRDVSARFQTLVNEKEQAENITDEQQRNLSHLAKCLKEENRSYLLEIDTLKKRIVEAEGDIKVLRTRDVKQRLLSGDSIISVDASSPTDRYASFDLVGDVSNVETILGQLEHLQDDKSQLELDLKSVLCEKEELIIERDTYKTKFDRLNMEMNYVLSGDDKRVADIDTVLMENRYLKEQLQISKEENSMAKATVSKYRGLLHDKKEKLSTSHPHNTDLSNNLKKVKFNGAVKSSVANFGSVITPKQVQEILNDPQSKVDHKTLSCALLDAVNDKTLALSHQRKANKILGTHVRELESRIHELEIRTSPGRTPEMLSPIPPCPKNESNVQLIDKFVQTDFVVSELISSRNCSSLEDDVEIDLKIDLNIDQSNGNCRIDDLLAD